MSDERQASERAKQLIAEALSASNGGLTNPPLATLLDYIASLEADRERLRKVLAAAEEAPYALDLYGHTAPANRSGAAIWSGPHRYAHGATLLDCIDAMSSSPLAPTQEGA